MEAPLADVWIVLGPAIGLVAAGIGLSTALISRSTTLDEREIRRQEREAAAADGVSVLLPPRVRHFVDRANVIEMAISEISAGERVLAIAGGAGVGKSAVATELVHQLRADGERHGLDLRHHNILWIDGKNDCPSLLDISRQVTLLTGDQSLSTVAASAKLEALRAHLARTKTVLLLDNVKFDGDPSAEPLGELLRTIPSGSLAITSLNSPGVVDGPRVLLKDLEPEYASELIRHEGRRLGLEESLFDADLVARLLHAVGGNPRLIESFLRALSRSPRPLEELLDAVEQGEGLDELYKPVWDELSGPAREVLGACACLHGEAIAEQLATACAVDRPELLRPLEELAQIGLLTVVRGVGRPEVYVCSPSLRRFVIVETPDEEIGGFARRLAGYYVRQFAAEPENARWAVPHVAGINAVLQWLYDRGEDAEVGALFASVLDILFTLGLFDDRISTGRLAYESAMRAGNSRGASLAVDVLASTHAARGELGDAAEAVALGLLAAERSDDSGERARMMRANALVLYKERDAGAALSAMEGVEELARSTGDLEVLVNVCGLRTVAHWYQGEFEQAAAAADEGLRVCQDMAWQRAMAYPLRNLAEVAIHEGDIGHARTLLGDARRIAEEHGDRRQLARIHLTSARLELLGGELSAALREVLEADSASMKLGLTPETREASAMRRAIVRARILPPLRLYYRRRRPARFSDAPAGGD